MLLEEPITSIFRSIFMIVWSMNWNRNEETHILELLGRADLVLESPKNQDSVSGSYSNPKLPRTQMISDPECMFPVFRAISEVPSY